MPESVLSRSGCVRRKRESPRNVWTIKTDKCNSSVLPRHVFSKGMESRQDHVSAYFLHTPEYRSKNNKCATSSVPNRLTASKAYNLSEHSLFSPSLLRFKTEMVTPMKNYPIHSNSSPGCFLQDARIYKQAKMNYMSPNSDNYLMYYSRSELDTASICGRCGQTKVCESPLRSCHSSRNDIFSNGMDFHFSNQVPKSPMNMWRKYVKVTNGTGRRTKVSQFSAFPKSYSQPSLRKLLCWRNEDDEADLEYSSCNPTLTSKETARDVNNFSSLDTLLDAYPRVNVMLRYLRQSEELHVTLLEAFNLVRDTSKSFATFAKICLAPGKKQTKISTRVPKTCNPVFEEDFCFSMDINDLVSCDLKIKFYIKRGILSTPTALGACIIPLDRYSSSVASVVCKQLN